MEPTLNARQQAIVEMVASNGEVKVAELRNLFGVTEMTIRRDLEKLEQIGSLHRTFGGAIAASKDIALNERSGFMTDEKERIGRKAASLVQNGESIFIDGGTTTLAIARHLKPGLGATVVTNALNIATELLDKKISVIVIGGMLVEATASLVGPLAVDALGNMAFHRIFLGATGLTASHGFSNSNVYEAEVKRQAIARASEVNIVIDHTKFGVKQLVSFAELRQATRILSSRVPDKQLLAACREANVDIIDC